MRIGFILSLVFAILVALFGIQNSTIISVNFFSTTFDISLALVIFISTIIGAIIVALLGLKKEFALSRGNKRLARKANNFENEIETFKNENMALKTENDIYKSKIEDLEAKNKAYNDELNALNIEVASSDKL